MAGQTSHTRLIHYEAHSAFWERERASEGRRCFERGTLNADRRANWKGAALFNGLSSWRGLQKTSSEYLKCHLEAGRNNDWGDEAMMLSPGPSPRLLHGPPDVGSSLGNTGVAGEVIIFEGTFNPVLGTCHWHERRHRTQCRRRRAGPGT